MKHLFAPCLLLGAALFHLPHVARGQELFNSYQNARYGTTVRYPANLLVPQPESENGDGRKFLSRDGFIELTVYGSHNVFSRSAAGEMRRAIADWKADGASLTYYRATNGWFVLSGYLGGDIFYEKTLLRHGVFHTLIWQYPKTLKKRLDASVSRSAASFSVGQGIEVTTPQPTKRPPTAPSRRAASTRRRTSRPTATSSGY